MKTPTIDQATDTHAPQVKRNHGFTLLELLIVVAIIGTLAALAIPLYRNYIDRAKVVVATATLDTVKKALVSYQIDYYEYPASIDFVTGLDGSGLRVLQPDLVGQVAKNLFAVDSYTRVGIDYELKARANDTNRTLLTVTSESITR